MNYKKVFWGAILVIFGVLLLLKNTGVLYFSWYSIWHMWPVLLILWGMSMLPVKDYIKLIISIIIIILSIVFIYKKGDDNGWHWHFGSHWYNDNSGKTTQILNEPYDSTTKLAILKFDAAAGAFRIQDSTSKLIDFEKKGDVGTYSIEIQKVGDSSVINLKMRDVSTEDREEHGNKVLLKLNPKPDWEFDMDVGASSIDFDLSKFRIKKIDMNGGASSVNLKIGNLQKETSLEISSGASSIRIIIPKTAGCEVTSSSFLSSRHLEGFTKQEDGTYRTDNYSGALQKININLESAISSLSVQRY